MNLDEDIVLRRIGRPPQNIALTVLRYLSDSRQYSIKLDAAFTVINKLKMLFNTEKKENRAYFENSVEFGACSG